MNYDNWTMPVLTFITHLSSWPTSRYNENAAKQIIIYSASVHFSAHASVLTRSSKAYLYICLPVENTNMEYQDTVASKVATLHIFLIVTSCPHQIIRD